MNIIVMINDYDPTEDMQQDEKEAFYKHLKRL